MHSGPAHTSVRQLLLTIVGGSYSPSELRSFVEYCYFLALPLVQRKIVTGRLRPDRLGMSESDIVYDCLAELFQRDAHGVLVQVDYYVQLLEKPVESYSETDVTIALRRLVFGAVQQQFPRLYANLDPALGKILRNLRLAVDRSGLLTQASVFGEPHIVPSNLDLERSRPPWTVHDLTREFSLRMTVHDNMPAIASKLYRMLLENEEYQRSVPFVLFALLVKDMYALDWELQETVRSVEDEAETGFVKDAVENGCRTVWQEHAPAYVETGKKTQEVYEAYLKALKEIILSSVEGEDDRSFYDVLNMYLPGLDRSEYKNVHRSTLEYLVKMTRKRLRREFGGKNFRGDSRM